MSETGPTIRIILHDPDNQEKARNDYSYLIKQLGLEGTLLDIYNREGAEYSETFEPPKGE